MPVSRLLAKSSASYLVFAAILRTFYWLGSSWSSGIIRMSAASSGATDLVVSLFFAVADFEWFVVLAMARDLEAGPGRDSLSLSFQAQHPGFPFASSLQRRIMSSVDRIVARSKPHGFGQVYAEAVLSALIAVGHFRRGMSQLFLDVAFVDCGRTGESRAQAVAGEEG